jgi:twitching motility protein PilT
MKFTLKEIFEKAVEKKASDVHLVAYQPPVFRIDGELIWLKDFPPLKPEDLIDLIEPILNESQKKEIYEKKELDTSYGIDKNIRFRINLYWEKGNLALASRIIWPYIPSFEEIGLPEIAKKLCELKQGLIIVTGPAGCGKSTTLASMINYINQTRNCNIITLEDPIEFVFTPIKSLITQRELKKDMLSFYDALKHVVRQDPNVIMVGEMRDLETMSLTLTLAETGHLIFTTLHTPNAIQTIDRIIDVFPPYQQSQIRVQLALSLKAIIAQQLLPKKEGGRVAVREILINTPAVANLIRENKIAQIKSVIQTSLKDGMISFEQSLKKLLEEGVISYEIASLYFDNF